MSLKIMMGASIAVLALTLSACDSGTSTKVEDAVKTSDVMVKSAKLGTFGIAG